MYRSGVSPITSYRYRKIGTWLEMWYLKRSCPKLVPAGLLVNATYNEGRAHIGLTCDTASRGTLTSITHAKNAIMCHYNVTAIQIYGEGCRYKYKTLNTHGSVHLNPLTLGMLLGFVSNDSWWSFSVGSSTIYLIAIHSCRSLWTRPPVEEVFLSIIVQCNRLSMYPPSSMKS